MHDTKSLEMNVHESVPHEDRIEPSFDQVELDKNSDGPGRLGEFELDSEYNKLAWILYPMDFYPMTFDLYMTRSVHAYKARTE